MRLITGMHRSGTSLVARLFFEGGADLGDPETFYRADRWNPDGYYEQPDIHAINMPLINGPFGKLAYFWLPTTDRILRRASRRADQIRETAQKYAGRVVKETRFCLTLPAWLEHGASIDRIIVCLRDPIDVAASLRKRNHITTALGLRLWRVHNERLLTHVADIPHWFVYYPNLLEESAFLRETGAAFHFFGYDPPSSQVVAMYEKCVNTRSCHTGAPTVSYPGRVDSIWRELMRKHAAQFGGTGSDAVEPGEESGLSQNGSRG